MSRAHADPSANGQRFGVATVTVDLENGDCMLHVDAVGFGAKRRPRFCSLDEIQGAYQVHYSRAAIDPVSRDIASALKFAAQQLKARQGGHRHG